VAKEKFLINNKKQGLIEVLFTREEMVLFSVSGRKSNIIQDSETKPALSINKVLTLVGMTLMSYA
jgi:hypothetical protein